MAVAILVPFTFALEPSSGLIVLGAIYTGAIFGGSWSAILINTPGTPSAVATTFDGYPLAKKAVKKEINLTEDKPSQSIAVIKELGLKEDIVKVAPFS